MNKSDILLAKPKEGEHLLTKILTLCMTVSEYLNLNILHLKEFCCLLRYVNFPTQFFSHHQKTICLIKNTFYIISNNILEGKSVSFYR